MKSTASEKNTSPSVEQKTEPAAHSRARERFTAVAVRNLSTPGFHHDGAGLYLQVSKSGSKSWAFRYTLNKQIHFMGLGSYPDWSLAEARDRARRCRQLLDDGIDPITQRNEERHAREIAEANAKKLARTFKQCAEEYHALHKDDWKNKKHSAQWINTLTTYAFPHFGQKPVSDITSDHIRDALKTEWKKKSETLSRVLQRIRTVINYAAAMGYCAGLDSEAWAQIKMTLGKQKEATNFASCPYEQVGAVMKAVMNSTSSDTVKLAFQFIVLNASRSGEVRGAVWEEIDLAKRIWKIPPERMKANREHSVPLSNEAWSVLEQAKLLQPQNLLDGKKLTGLIFPNTKKTALSDMTFTQFLRRMHLSHTTHGFRASFRTWGAAETKYEHELLEFSLAHIVGDKTERAYQRSDMVERRRQLMQDWADYIHSKRDEPLTLIPSPKKATTKKT
ncbi:integrase arm-type DNA-binding domain-containing protein [Variovorax sp. PCZ-1]|uniref:tyrosine-type recombinase/integrase n=1 Tax=Variovorax sp. PCZ-1 TaxID=2835533 RepID=UPI001BCBC14F|nr:integrase arm-type DNA-binding domain-containing protein [Variovorax sp. PCZ-1]MBS7807954.1 integrase arm-type DNA-binding domain-containing protein [Variovorax sp. PCZ-1]